MAQISNIGALTFGSCKALEDLCFSEAIKAGVSVAPDAFDGASKNFESASFTQSTTGEVTLTVNYVFADGAQAAEPVVKVCKIYEPYSITSPTIEGYTASKLSTAGIISGDTVETVTYTPTEAAAQPEGEQTPDKAPEQETPDETKPGKIGVGTIITIVIFVIVIGAIVVLAVVMMRSDKKQNAPKSNKNAKGKKR
jgi:hypothetical protein